MRLTFLLAGLLAAAAIVVIGVKVRDALHAPAPRPVVHDRTTVLQTPVLTPLPRDSGPRNNQRPRTVAPPGAAGKRPVPVARGPRSQNRSLPSRKPRTVKTRPDRRRPSQRPQQPGQPSNPPTSPPQPSKPPVCVRAPAPVTLNTPVAGVNVC